MLLRLLSPLSKWRVSITPTECINCRLCEDACPYNAITTPTPAQSVPRAEGKGRLALLVLLLPVLIGVGSWLGFRDSGVPARQHPTIILALHLRAEDAGGPVGATDDAKAYHKLGKPNDEVYQQEARLRRQFAVDGALLGAWVGLVLGLALINFAVRRTRTLHEADPAACVACGRCYRACPVKAGPPLPAAPATDGQ